MNPGIKINSVIVFLLVLFTTNNYARDYTIGWNANSEADLAGYKLYWGTESRKYDNMIDVGDTTEYTVNLPDSINNFIAVTAYDTANNESGFSNELQTDSVNVNNTIYLYWITAQDTINRLDFCPDSTNRINVDDLVKFYELFDRYLGRKVEK